jgi:hypothetical protein
VNFFAAAALAAVTVMGATGAKAPSARGLPPSAKAGARGTKKPPAPLPSSVAMILDAPSPAGPWTIRVINEGEVPVRIVADARLLLFDVTPRGARRPVRCELPQDMRPADDLHRPLVLPPGQPYAESFEPRLYCFGDKVGALAPGAIVVAHLGWPRDAANRPPFAVSPIDGVEPTIASSKTIDGLPIRLPDEPTASRSTADGLSEAQSNNPGDLAIADARRLVLTGAAAVDAASAEDAIIAVSLRNEGSRSAIVRFRPETLAFDVVGPNGGESCTWPVLPSAPVPEGFATVAPKASVTLRVLLSAYCGNGALETAGLLVVRPRLDTRLASGTSVGIASFDGVVIAQKPTIVRLHRGTVPAPLRRAFLEPR